MKAFDAHLITDEDTDEVRCVAPSGITRKDGRPRLSTRNTRWGTTWRWAFYGTRPDFADSDDLDDDTKDDDTKDD